MKTVIYHGTRLDIGITEEELKMFVGQDVILEYCHKRNSGGHHVSFSIHGELQATSHRRFKIVRDIVSVRYDKHDRRIALTVDCVPEDVCVFDIYTSVYGSYAEVRHRRFEYQNTCI